MKIAFSAMLTPLQGHALSRQSGTKVDALLSNAAQAVRSDRVSIGAGRKNAAGSSDSFLKNLTDHKAFLQDRRRELLAKTAETPSQKEALTYKIQEIDKQLGEISQQLSEYLLQKQQQALEKQKEERAEDFTPEQAREKQMQDLAAAKEKLNRSAELGVTRAVLVRSLAHAKEWMGNSHSVSASGALSSGYANTVSKLERGILGLEHSQRSLAAEAQKLADEGYSLTAQAAKTEQPEKEEENGMLPCLEEELTARQNKEPEEEK